MTYRVRSYGVDWLEIDGPRLLDVGGRYTLKFEISRFLTPLSPLVISYCYYTKNTTNRPAQALKGAYVNYASHVICAQFTLHK